MRCGATRKRPRRLRRFAAAVVLSELRRGARTPSARRLVDSLHRLARVRWEPSAADWWEAGKLVREIGDVEDWEINKRRERALQRTVASSGYPGD